KRSRATDVLVFGRRQYLDEPGLARQLRKRRPDDQQPIRVREREGMEDEAVDDAEDRGVAADAEREREDRDGGKAGTPCHLPARVAQVLSEGVHRAAPRAVKGTRGQALGNGTGK